MWTTSSRSIRRFLWPACSILSTDTGSWNRRSGSHDNPHVFPPTGKSAASKVRPHLTPRSKSIREVPHRVGIERKPPSRPVRHDRVAVRVQFDLLPIQLLEPRHVLQIIAAWQRRQKPKTHLRKQMRGARNVKCLAQVSR